MLPSTDETAALAQFACAALAVVLFCHALVALVTFTPEPGPGCHFCAIQPGLGGVVLELGLGVPAFVVVAAGLGAERFDPWVPLSPTVRRSLLGGAALVLLGTTFTVATMGYGILYGGPVAIVGYLGIGGGVVLGVVRRRRRTAS